MTSLRTLALALLIGGVPAVASPLLVPIDDPVEHTVLAVVDGATEADAAALDAELGEHAKALARALSREGPISTAEARKLLERQIFSRLLARKHAGLTTSVDQARRIVLGFEAYKAQTYVTSGVYPRRYFGYLDAVGDTAAEELRVVQTIRATTDASNAWLAEQGIAWRVTDQEIAVTWIAEGGALMLQDPKSAARPVHPILDIGLDDIAHGFKELPGLVGQLDAAAGTHVEDIPAWQDGRWSLTRHMNLEESVVGTGIMWVWEKRIADRKLREGGRAELQTYDAKDQFILASLVYNSGLIHSPARPPQVRRHSLGPHLSGLARTHNPTGRRAHLPVLPPSEALARLMVDREYPYQGTSWIALYHIQQRYGGYESLQRFTDVFDADGRFDMAPWQALEARLAAERAAEEVVEADESVVVPLPPAPPRASSCGCRASPVSGGGIPLAVLLLALARRGRGRRKAALS